MRKNIVFLLALASFAACDLNKLEPAQTSAFMKYFGDFGNTVGVDLLKLDDGYLLLGNNTNDGSTTAVLIKVDELGNIATPPTNFPNFKGSALAKTADSYFIVGDGIDITDLDNTKLSLIKTDLQGVFEKQVILDTEDNNIPYHGTALTVSTSNGFEEIIVTGYNYGNGLDVTPNQTLLYGYDTDLEPAWSNIEKTNVSSAFRKSSKTLLEINSMPGTFILQELRTDNGVNHYRALSSPEEQTPGEAADLPLLEDSVIDNSLGDFTAIGNSFVGVQTIIHQGKQAIGITKFNYNGEIARPGIIPAVAENKRFNIEANTVLAVSDVEIVVLGSTDMNRDNDGNRSDTDFYITRVNIYGQVEESTGFANTFGGTGSERGAAIVQANDGGYVFLGTMLNTNGFNIMVLVKVNNRGELLN